MDSSGDRMPLPDANKRSPRVYTNLQNIDLDTVTFANVQDTGNPIAIEEMNEDEMRRLVLVNLARLVCAGEWNGLLTSGGSPTLNAQLTEQNALYEFGGTTYDVVTVTQQIPYGYSAVTTRSLSIDDPVFYPFVAPNTGTVSAVSIEVTTTATGTNCLVGIYDDDGTGCPNDLLGYATITLDATGYIRQTSLSATVTTTVGTQYWIAYVRDASGSGAVRAAQYTYAPSLGPGTDVGGNTPNGIRMMNNTNSMPASANDKENDYLFGVRENTLVALEW